MPGDCHRASGTAFPDTSWGLVLGARAGAGRDALDALCRRYWMPIYASLRRQGFAPADAEDLVQGFLLHVIERGLVARADPARGRFRSFLLGALRWFLANQRTRAHARRRGGQCRFVDIDLVGAEASLGAEQRHETIDMAFDRQWARTLVDNALRTLEQEYGANGHADVYRVLRPCLDPVAQCRPHAALALQLQRNEGAIKVAVHRLRSRFREVLRDEIGCTVATAQDIDDELAYLRDVLAAQALELA